MNTENRPAELVAVLEARGGHVHSVERTATNAVWVLQVRWPSDTQAQPAESSPLLLRPARAIVAAEATPVIQRNLFEPVSGRGSRLIPGFACGKPHSLFVILSGPPVAVVPQISAEPLSRCPPRLCTPHAHAAC